MAGKKIKIIGSILVIVGAGIYVWYTVSSHNQGLPREEARRPGPPPGPGAEARAAGAPNTAGQASFNRVRPQPGDPQGQSPVGMGPGGMGPGGFRNMTPEQREERRREFARQLGLTDEQMKQMQALRQEGGGPPNREEIAKILTPEQQTRMEERFRGRREEMRARLMERLSPEDRKAMEKRMKEREALRGERGWGPPPGGPGGRRGGGNIQGAD